MNQFNATIDQWIAALDDYTPDMLRREPAPGSWSLGQVYTHLIDDTGFFVTQMRAALSTTAHAEETMHEHARWMFVRDSFPETSIAGPATGKHIPQPENPRHDLQKIRDEVNALDFTKPSGKAKHPGLGYFTASEWLQFAEMHMRHHFRQKQRIDAFLRG